MLNILISGVGGQGNLLASRVIAECAIKKGMSARTAETIGMAQREGSVVSHVRIGEKINSSLIAEAQGDILIGMECAEAARNLNKIKPKTAHVIVNDYAIIPAVVSIGKSSYDIENIRKFIVDYYPEAIFIPASEVAESVGSIRATNVVMLGALAELAWLPFDKEDIWQSLEALLPQKLHALNRKAFEAGRNLID